MANIEQSSSNEPENNLFDEFYNEVKQIEKRDSVLTPKQQIDRLNRPGSSYFNLNPFDVLMVDPDTPLSDIKKKYRQMSILVHPDKNIDDAERSQKAFDSLNKAYKTLENDEGYRRCKEIVDEAKLKVDEMVAQKRKKLKKEGKNLAIDEDDALKYKHAIYVQTCKLFADLERLRVEQEHKNANERKRKAVEEVEEKQRVEVEKEWNKNYEDSRTGRVNSWREFTQGSKEKKSKKKKLNHFRPPKPKMEERPS